MRRGWKIFWLACASVAAAGIIICGVAWAAGFSWRMWPRTILNNDLSFNFAHTGYKSSGSSEGSSVTGSGTESYSGIDELELYMSAGSLTVSSYEGSEVKVETTDIPARLNYNCYQDGNTLHIETDASYWGITDGFKNAKVKVLVPKGMNLKKTDLGVGAGTLMVSGLNAESMDMESGAGNVTMSEVITGSLNIQCGAGSVVFQGAASGDIDIEAGVGRAELTLDGSEAEYNYDVDCGVGSVKIGDSSYHSLSDRTTKDNGADWNMSIETGVGSVAVTFKK